ncbi:uncharacterized protein [Chelonus insularis]|uniref:uncharacterized protein n=1 Tax=Chelonus insularis TaxID=460826 RepID=UPI00158D0606|nr:uncharacterized protein LOC118064304 [Chelonus insularis]
MVCNLKRILFVWFILFNRSCQSMKCYQCNSLLNPNCTEKAVDTKYLQDCSKMHNACRKMSSAYYFKSPTEYVTIRECAFLYKEDNKCYKGANTQTSYQHICECKSGPGCNKSSKNVLWSLPLVFIIQLILLSFSELLI